MAIGTLGLGLMDMEIICSWFTNEASWYTNYLDLFLFGW